MSRAQPTLAATPNAQPAVAGSIGSREEGLQWDVHEGADVGGGVVAGIVKDELGRPRTGISAILLENGDPAKQQSMATDAEGRFRFENLAERRFRRLEAFLNQTRCERPWIL